MALPGVPPVPEGTTELGIDIIKVERIAAAIKQASATAFRTRVLTETEAALRAQSAAELRRPLGGQGGRVEGARPGRARRRLARHRDRAPAHRRADRCGSTAAPRRAPSSWAWAASPSRSATRATTRWPSRSASAPQGGTFVFPLDIEERLDEPRAPDPGADGAAARHGEGRCAEAVGRGDARRRRTARRSFRGATRTATRAPSARSCALRARSTTRARRSCAATAAARGGAGLVALAVPARSSRSSPAACRRRSPSACPSSRRRHRSRLRLGHRAE